MRNYVAVALSVLALSAQASPFLLADAGQFDRITRRITRRINGPAMAGHADRVRLYNRAFQALEGV